MNAHLARAGVRIPHVLPFAARVRLADASLEPCRATRTHAIDEAIRQIKEMFPQHFKEKQA